ncbi:tetratricopeptide repeat family protein [Aquipluma nitroreducens]|uniref:Tetratricopeptide repeat family protein n=1 Tax=Aquipluma nitroreducens TaxID=2010828 RepID=A0A5K7SCR0_9BACT|nr:tetratricopeptide repeat protein [Aquipluma nitroreducens]BBE19391.1 tetratricopeptide repeat family protein [Aquipluma nitroreducens]
MITPFFKKTFLILALIVISGVAGLKAQTLDEAITAMNNERYDKADEILQDLAKKSASSKIYYLLGENTLLNFFADTISNSQKAVMAEAKGLFDKGIALNANDPFNYIGLAKVASYSGDQQSATQMRLKAKSFLLPYKKVTKIPNAADYALTLAKLAESYIVFDKVDTTMALPLVREALTIDEKNPTIYIIAGDIYLLVNNGSLAIRNYNRAQDCDPQSPIANMKIGYIYFKGRNLMAAIPYFEQAIALNKNYAPAYRELGQLYSMAGRFKESKENFETYLTLTNQNVPAKIRYVNALFYSKNYAEVVKNVEDIFAVDKSRTYLNRVAGYSCYEQGDYAKALTYMNNLFAQLPADRILKKDYIYYARIIMKNNEDYGKELGDLEKAKADLAKVQEKNEALKGAAKEKEKVSEEPLVAKIAEIQKSVDASEKELDKGYDAYEKAITFGEEDTYLIQEKARNLYNQRRYSEAAANWERLIAKGKNSEENYLQIGKAYYQGKDFDKAEVIFKDMTEKFPDYIPGYQWAANNAAAKDPDSKLGLTKPRFEALIAKAATDSVKYSEEIFNALRFLGYNALQADRNDEAKAYYNRMLNLDPNNKDFQVKALSSLNTLYMTTGEYGKALEYDNKILAIEPGNGAAKANIQYIQALQSSAKPKANPNEISGVIKDESGTPIASASVRVKDTAAEAWTNAKGEYRFTMPEASTTLVISANGYTTKEVAVTKSRVYNSTLSK